MKSAAKKSSAIQNERYFGRGYGRLYRDYLLPVEQTQAEADFLVRTLRPRPTERWLDMPCGYGRHLAALRTRRPDLRLFGGDLNRDYLRDPDAGCTVGSVICDMRGLPFADGRFDTVLNMLNSFGYFPPVGRRREEMLDDRTVLDEFARVLRPGGMLTMDLPNRCALVTLVNRQPRIRYSGADYDVTETFAWDATAQCLSNQTHWRWPGGKESRSYRVRLYTPSQMQRMLSHAGFTIKKIYGNFRGEQFDPYHSDRMLLLAHLDD